tara:strand:- start:1408 stop:2226 length:819 start_codon:yes stop_codon:yes gene_type:complete
MDEDTINAIDDYYKLKQKYETTLERKKQKIISNPSLTTKAKQQKIKEIRTTCVNCGKLGGTIFKSEENTLIAVCNANTPCNLNINIKRGFYANIRTECYNLHDKMIEIQNEIIETKLKILFGYTTEDEAVRLFKKLRGDLTKVVKIYTAVRKEYLNIVTRGEQEPELIERRNTLRIALDDLKELSASYDAIDKNVESGDTLIKDIVEKYINDVLPAVRRIRELSYVDSKMEYVVENTGDGNNIVAKLVQEPYTISDLYVSGTERAQVISNSK